MSLAFTSFAFDKAVYNSGDTITLTVEYTSSDLAADSVISTAVTVTLNDSASGSVSQTSDGSASFPEFSVDAGPATTAEAVDVTATDPRPGTWTLVSNAFTGTSAPFAGQAVLTSVA